MTKKKFMRILPKKVIQIGTADPRTREQTEKKEEAHQGVRKEEEEQTVSVRSRFKGDEGSQKLDDFIAAITEEIRTKEIRKEEVQE